MTEQSAPEPQAGEEQAQAAASQEPQGQASSGAGQGQAAPITAQTVDELPKWAQDELKNVRKEAARLRTEQKKREDAEKSQLELEQAAKQAAEDELNSVKSELREFRFSEAIQLPNKEYAWLAAQKYGIEIDFDESNRPTNAEKVAKELIKRDPRLFGTKGADAGDKGTEAVEDGSPATSLARILGVG